MNIEHIYIQAGYMGKVPNDIRVTDKDGQVHIITNALEYLQKAIEEKGATPTLKPGQKIYRTTINI